MKQFDLPALPYALDGLEPVLSRETLEYHYGKHHQAYITNLNGLISGTDYENMPIEDIVAKADAGPMFNNSAQAFNHTFYWYGMAPSEGGDNQPTDQVGQALREAFGSFEQFRDQFSEVALKHFGSGWAWLLKDHKSGKLEIKGMHDADTPIRDGDVPLLALDVWEHAYYIDYRNKRPDYITAFWQLVDWNFVQSQLLGPKLEPLMTTREVED